MTDKEIATLYRRWFLCITKRMKPSSVVRAMKRFTVENPEVVCTTWIAKKYVRHSLWYNQEKIYSIEV